MFARVQSQTMNDKEQAVHSQCTTKKEQYYRNIHMEGQMLLTMFVDEPSKYLRFNGLHWKLAFKIFTRQCGGAF